MCVFVKLQLPGVCVYVCDFYEHVLHSCALDHGKQTLLPTCITLWHLQYRNSG